MARVPASNFGPMTPDRLLATVEFQKRQATVQKAQEDLIAGRISAAEAQERVEKAYRKFRKASESGDLHFEL